jgi:hypothetical protein
VIDRLARVVRVSVWSVAIVAATSGRDATAPACKCVDLIEII